MKPPTVPWEELRHAVHDAEAVAALTGLIMFPMRWIHRRVETVSFVDGCTVRRRVSLDFTVPSPAPAVRTGAGTPRLLPVASFAKHSLMNFDLRDEQDSALFLLSASQNAALSLQVLLRFARGHLRRAPHCLVETWLRRLVMHTPEDTALVRNAMLSDPEARADFEELWERPVFRGLAEELAVNFLLYAVVDDPPGARRVLKYSVDIPLGSVIQTEQRWHRKAAVWLGLHPAILRIPCPNAPTAHSFHFDLGPPAGVFVLRGRIALTERGDEGRVLREIAEVQRVEGRLHLHARDLSLGARCVALVDILPAPGGWLTAVLSAAVIAMVILLLTGFGVLSASSEEIQRPVLMSLFAVFAKGAATPDSQLEPAVAILLSITAVFVTVLSRVDGHDLVARVVRGVRAAAVLAAVVPAVGSVLVVFGWAKDLATWSVLWALSLVSVALLVLSWRTAWVKRPRAESVTEAEAVYALEAL